MIVGARSGLSEFGAPRLRIQPVVRLAPRYHGLMRRSPAHGRSAGVAGRVQQLTVRCQFLALFFSQRSFTGWLLRFTARCRRRSAGIRLQPMARHRRTFRAVPSASTSAPRLLHPPRSHLIRCAPNAASERDLVLLPRPPSPVLFRPPCAAAPRTHTAADQLTNLITTVRTEWRSSSSVDRSIDRSVAVVLLPPPSSLAAAAPFLSSPCLFQIAAGAAVEGAGFVLLHLQRAWPQ